MVNKLLSALKTTGRMLKNIVLRPHKTAYSKIRYFFSVGRLTSAIPGAVKKLPKILKTKPENRGDYFDWGSVYVAKSLVIAVTVIIIAVVLAVIFILRPMLISWFGTKDFVLNDKNIYSYSGKVRVYYDNKLESIEFTGKLKDGKPIEFGEEYYESGQRKFAGNFTEGEISGEGREYFPDKTLKYSGGFADGLYEGSGILYLESGAKLYSGGFEKGKYSGNGTLYNADGSKLFFGEFEDGIYNGEGSLYGSYGSVTTGAFANGEISGAARRVFSNGTEYDGLFSNGLMNGAGRLSDVTGAFSYTGTFLDNGFDYREILGGDSAAVQSAMPSLTRKVETDCFYLEDKEFGVVMRCGFAQGDDPAKALEMFDRPIGGKTYIINSVNDIPAPNADSIAEVKEKSLPEWASAEFGITAGKIKCYAAYYDGLIVYYWTDAKTGALLLRSGELAKTENPDKSDKPNEPENPDAELDIDEIKSIFDELGLDINDFAKTLGIETREDEQAVSLNSTAIISEEYSDKLTAHNNALYKADGDISETYAELLGAAREYQNAALTAEKELSENLIDYDVMLKKLKILIGRYSDRVKNAEEISALALVGEYTNRDVSAAEKEAENALLEIKAALSEISALKESVEKKTGAKLKDNYDFDGVYYIINPLETDGSELSGAPCFSSICVPNGVEREEYRSENVSISNAIKAYYTLCTAITEYISAVSAQREGEKSRMPGEITEKELSALTKIHEDKFLAAISAKADFSKLLLTPKNLSARADNTMFLRETIPESEKGTGFWTVNQTADGAELCPITYPTADFDYFTVKYGGKIIGTAKNQEPCAVTKTEYKDGENYAEVEFYKGGWLSASYYVSIFAPYGEFLKT